MFSDYDTTASKLSCDEIPLVQSFQPIGNELTFCVLWCKLRNGQTIVSKKWVIAHRRQKTSTDLQYWYLLNSIPGKTFNQGRNVQAMKRTFKIVFCQRVEQGSHCTDESALSMATWIIYIWISADFKTNYSAWVVYQSGLVKRSLIQDLVPISTKEPNWSWKSPDFPSGSWKSNVC